MALKPYEVRELNLKLRLLDLLFTKIAIKLIDAGGRLPLSIRSPKVSATVGRHENYVVYDVDYAFHVVDSQGQLVLDFACTIGVPFQVEEGFSPTSAQLREFVVQVYQLAHPYLVEFVHSITLKAGLPPLILEIFKPQPAE